MAQLACEHISGVTFRPWFGRELTPDALAQMIRSVFPALSGDVQHRPDGDHLYLDWEEDGLAFTAGLHASSLLFISLRPGEGRLTAREVIECMGAPAYYQAWYQFYPGLQAGSAQVAMIFFVERVVAYAARHYAGATAQPPTLDDGLPINLVGVFGEDWQRDPRALNRALPWPGSWQNLRIETTIHREVPAGSAMEPSPNAASSPAPPIDAALSQIAIAFAGAPRPPNAELLHPQAYDDNDIRALYGVPRWQEMPDATIENEYAALAFLSPAGFRHFLAAYMIWVLRHPASGAAVVSATILALTPVRDEPLAAYMLSKFSLLDEAQRAAVLTFLRAMQGFEDVRAALAYWE